MGTLLNNSASTPKSINFMFWLKLIGLAGVALIIVGLLKKFGLFKKQTEADKLQEAKDTEDKTKAIELNKSTALKISGISDFLKYGLGAAEQKNQFPYTPAQVTAIVQQIYGSHKMVGRGDGATAIAAIASLPSKLAVNNIALSFQNDYGKDMLTFLQSNVEDAGLAKINDDIKSKPDFVPLLPASQALLKQRNQTLTL